jgi:hypothetical protein
MTHQSIILQFDNPLINPLQTSSKESGTTEESGGTHSTSLDGGTTGAGLGGGNS